MDSRVSGNVYKVDFRTTTVRPPVGVPAIVRAFRVAQNATPMGRLGYAHYPITEAPGANVHRLRTERGWSLRDLANKTHPALDHTTIRRLEWNEGYTQDTLERVAKVLGVTVADLFLPPELVDWPSLTPEVKSRVAASVKDAAELLRYKKTRPR